MRDESVVQEADGKWVDVSTQTLHHRSSSRAHILNIPPRQCIPEWTNPTHASASADYYTPYYRPALLPTDAPLLPTREAPRFGINPDAAAAPNPPNAAIGRSMMTPLTAPNPNIDADLERAYQAVVLEGFTTAELAAMGAYRPDDAFAAPDLAGELHPMLARAKWSQARFKAFDRVRGPQVTTAAGSEEGHPVLRYDVGGKTGFFDVSVNDELWAVMQPSLRLVSRIIGDHPVWNALLNVYHLRPLARSADSRTDKQLADDGNIARTTFWYVPIAVLHVLCDGRKNLAYDLVGRLDEQKQDDMYPGARTIHRSGFRETKEIMEDYLTRMLVLSFSGGKGTRMVPFFKV